MESLLDDYWSENFPCQENDFEVEIQVAKEKYSGTDNHV